MTTGLAYMTWLKVQSTKQGSYRKPSTCALAIFPEAPPAVRTAFALSREYLCNASTDQCRKLELETGILLLWTTTIRRFSVCLMEMIGQPPKMIFRNLEVWSFLSYTRKDLLQSRVQSTAHFGTLVS